MTNFPEIKFYTIQTVEDIIRENVESTLYWVSEDLGLIQLCLTRNMSLIKNFIL